MNTLSALFSDKKVIEVPKGKIIVYEGHKINKIYQVTSGYVKVYAVAGANTQRILFICKAGDVFPLTTFLSGQNVARFFYEAMTPATLQYITPKQLEHKLLNNLPLGEEIIAYTNYLDRQFIQQVNNMVSSKEPLDKLKSLLLFLCNRVESEDKIVKLNLPLSSKVFASMCGISTKEALKQVKYLKSLEIIVQNDGLNINVRKLQKLKT
jgi:CRP-like cAMP-binding protein